MVVQLFKEAGKAVDAMPLILLQPLLVRNKAYFAFRDEILYIKILICLSHNFTTPPSFLA
jgi:hypothetical protein